MARLTLLGTGSAWSGITRENTYMIVQGGDTRILVDCGGRPAQRLAAAGVDVASIDNVILTHADPDHIYGWPLFVLNAWMAGRRSPLQVYGLSETLNSARTMLRAVGSSRWPDFFPLRYHQVPHDGINLIMSSQDIAISTTVTDHFVPTIGLRITNEVTGASVAYSSDTAPSEYVVELARGAKYLFHEATMLDQPAPGHTTALQAGAQARHAAAKRLVLVHLPRDVRPALWRAAARQEFDGPVIVARDFQSFSF